MTEFVTRTGMILDDPFVDDIVTVDGKHGDGSYSRVIFKVIAVTSSSVAVEIVWSDEHLWNIGDRKIFYRRRWEFTEASELLEALDKEKPHA